eukprot:9208391-Ditylum_brightwellii.AAC.1
MPKMREMPQSRLSWGHTLEALNRSAYAALKTKVINNPEFLWKSGATHHCCCSCFKDDAGAWARWKRKKDQQDVYVDVMLSWPDVIVASKLCIGGPCCYKLKEGMDISDEWLIEYVVPNIAGVFPSDIDL